jgi:ferredoxin--NADP+ reductase
VSRAALTETARLKEALVSGLPSVRNGRSGKSVQLRFLGSPTQIVGEDRVRGVRVSRNQLSENGLVQTTPEVEELECSLVLRAIGYRGLAVKDLPFDKAANTLLNNAGRVIDSTSHRPLNGVYTTGWIKRGPSGVIGTNRKCAEQTVQAVLDDHAAGKLGATLVDPAGLDALIAARQPDALTYTDWQAIDRHERFLAHNQVRPRVKLTSIEQMLGAVRAGKPVSGGVDPTR